MPLDRVVSDFGRMAGGKLRRITAPVLDRLQPIMGEEILRKGDMVGVSEVSTPERICIGGPEQISISTASKQEGPISGGLLAFAGQILRGSFVCSVFSMPA